MTSPSTGNLTALLYDGPADINLGLLAAELTIYVQTSLEMDPQDFSTELDRQTFIQRYLDANLCMRELDVLRSRLPRPIVLPSIIRDTTTGAFKPIWRHWRDLHVDRTCDWCFDPIELESDAVPLECLHLVCLPCLNKSVEDAARFEVKYPAVCCKDLDVPAYGAFLDADTLCKYMERQSEYDTAVKDRVYCANKDCRQFLGGISESLNLKPRIWCRECRYTTCTKCKGVCGGILGGWHFCKPAAKDTLQIEYSADNRIKSCPNCSTNIMLSEACNHITCLACKHEFCFVCLQPWDMIQPENHPHCPLYNDPEYDEEGYSQDDQAIHRDTGMDRHGFNLCGFNAQGLNAEGGTEPMYKFNSTTGKL